LDQGKLTAAQAELERLNKMTEMLSQMMKAMHDTSIDAIHKMGGDVNGAVGGTGRDAGAKASVSSHDGSLPGSNPAKGAKGSEPASASQKPALPAPALDEPAAGPSPSGVRMEGLR
jgi:hypothetical protein